ncbi:MAG: hypothetical protein AVO33_08965 [delta proteobacterium ML8_F1]|nr:MAG: hypothetical protein AVO33_08965 [delta proteobacterium ML8_F1]
MGRVLGIDLGGTSVKYGILHEDRIISRGVVPTEIEKGTPQLIEKLKGIIRSGENVSAVGIGVPGIVDETQKFIYECKNLFWKEIPLARWLEEATGVEVFLDNDANLAALAEQQAGLLKGINNGILLTLGTGVGGGVILGGALYRGSHGLGFEVGHMRIGYEGIPCTCGRQDCFEVYSSATALVRHYNERAPLPVREAREIFDGYQKKDPLGIQSMDWYLDHLADGVVNLINLFDPQRIVFAGGVSLGLNLVLGELEKRVEQRKFTKALPRAELMISSLENDAGIYGGALLAEAMRKG